MSSWYETEDWYAPTEENSKKRAHAMQHTRIRIIGAIALILVLIVASSAIFAGRGSSSPLLPRSSSGSGYPENFIDFFSGYYKSVSRDTAEVNIPKYEGTLDFALELMPFENDELSLQELYAACSPSVVGVSAYADGKNGYAWGSGIIASPDGIIITNSHIVEGCDRAEVTLADDTVYEALLIGADSISDIAVLKIDAQSLPAAQFGDSAQLVTGESVAAIGNPLSSAFRLTMTDGIVSAIDRDVPYNGHKMTVIQTNAAINGGNSGGALFNSFGQVVGITNMKMNSSYTSIEGIGFAIPSSTVKNIVNALIRDGKVLGRTSIGLTLGAVSAEAAEHYGIPQGLYVSDVAEGSDAQAQGIKTGDIITAINGSPVMSTDEVSAIKDAMSVGDSMVLTVWRSGESFDVSIMLMDTSDIY